MKQWHTLVCLFVAALMLQLGSGCGGKEKTKASKGGEAESTEAEEGGGEESRTELAGTGWGTLKGKVTLAGDPPAAAMLPGIKEKKECHEGAGEQEVIEQTWLVSKDKEVANVAVWLQPPAGKYYKLKDEDKKRTDVVTLDQPHCAFVPHVFTLYPKYYDGKELVKSGQKFDINNSANFLHNTGWQGNPRKNPTQSKTINPKGKIEDVHLEPQDQPVGFKCDVHPWMRAVAFVFDHPYAAATDEHGNYEIKNVPTGVDVNVVAWHEGVKSNYALPEGGGSKTGQQIKLMDNESKELNFTVRAK